MNWLPRRNAVRTTGIPLFCFPFAGGGTSIYHQWEPGLRTECEVVPVKLPGRESRIHEPAVDDMDTLIERLLEGLAACWSRPFALFGHSMGALIAYELACRISVIGHSPAYLFVSSCRTPDPSKEMNAELLHELPDNEMVSRLLLRYGDGSISSDERGLMMLLAPTLRADLKLVETFHRPPMPRVSCPTMVVGGADDPQVSRADLQQWSRYVSGPFGIRVFPGGHFYLRHQKKGLTQLIADRLRLLS